MTIIVETRLITGGVDTHLDTHVAAALDSNGGTLGVASFPTTSAGFAELHTWLCSFGTLCRVGVEGTGAYGAGLARFLRGAGVAVIEVGRPNRQARRAHGKSDSVDAVEAARAALSGPRCGQDRGWQRGSDPGAARRPPFRTRCPYQMPQPASPPWLLRAR
jgi:transposase